MPLCVVAQGFASVFVLDYFARAQAAAEDEEAAARTDMALSRISSGAGAAACAQTEAEAMAGAGAEAGGQGAAAAGAGAGAAGSAAAGTTPLERGETLSYLCTLGSPLPLLAAAGGSVPGLNQLEVPTAAMQRKHPHLRGGWANFHPKGDPLSLPLAPCCPAIAQEHALTVRPRRDQPLPLACLADVAGVVRPVAQAVSWVWQDTNR